MLNAGLLRHRVQIQQRSSAQDSYGQQSMIWTTVATVWALIEPLSSRELLAAQAVQSDTTHQITVRYNAVFATAMKAAALRLLYGTRIFNITGSTNWEERNAMIILTASEGLNRG
jgi:SPP1 family predicted phage head-tail adaptor